MKRTLERELKQRLNLRKRKRKVLRVFLPLGGAGVANRRLSAGDSRVTPTPVVPADDDWGCEPISVAGWRPSRGLSVMMLVRKVPFGPS